ncbi:MAG: extracellular solute-binding protein [Gemmataceae bacterium]
MIQSRWSSQCWFLPVVAVVVALSGCGPAADKGQVTLYCAQDQEFAEHLLHDFTRQTGITVNPKFDTEANKSVGLYLELMQEQGRPRCDVFWNNEILSTIRLQKAGLLEPYVSPSALDFPDFARAGDATWTAFAGRARVLIVNTDLVAHAEMPRSRFDLLQPRWRGALALAKPQFGTTATEAACLFEVLGPEKAKEYYRGLKSNGVTILPGNKQVAEAVGKGRFAAGFTDTDDALIEIQAGRPVAMIFLDRDAPANDRMGTLFLPNTVAIIRDGPNPGNARKLVDYLLSGEVEKRLAEGGGHQIPFNPNLTVNLPSQMATPKDAKPMNVNFEKAAEMWDEVQNFLREEFGR